MTELDSSGYDDSAQDGTACEDSERDLGGIDLSRVWIGVAAQLWRRHPSPAERTAAWLLRSPGLARALLTTPSLLLPWLLSTVVVLGVGGLVSFVGGQPVVWVLAPGIAAIGIAWAYGPGIDPTWELSCSMPVSERMVLLVRGVCVFVVNAFLGLTFSAITYAVASRGADQVHAEAVAITVAWLLPMAAVCALSLAVALAARSAVAGAFVGVLAWAATILASSSGSGRFTAAVTDSSAYLPYLAVAACATVATGLVARSQRGQSEY